jgi:hypothetical protein
MSGSESDGDFGADVEEYDSQVEEDLENENQVVEKDLGVGKRDLSEDSEDNYGQPSKKKHKSNKKKDRKHGSKKGGKLIADISKYKDLDADVSSDAEFSEDEDEPEYDEGIFYLV